jgi:hypothetical protein
MRDCEMHVVQNIQAFDKCTQNLHWISNAYLKQLYLNNDEWR